MGGDIGRMFKSVPIGKAKDELKSISSPWGKREKTPVVKKQSQKKLYMLALPI